MSKIRITPEQLADLLGETRMSERTKEIARCIYVDGLSHTEIAANHGLKRQRVTQISAQVEQLLNSRSIDVSVVREFAFTASLSESLQEFENELKQPVKPEIRRLAVARVKRAVDISINMIKDAGVDP